MSLGLLLWSKNEKCCAISPTRCEYIKQSFGEIGPRGMAAYGGSARLPPMVAAAKGVKFINGPYS